MTDKGKLKKKKGEEYNARKYLYRLAREKGNSELFL